MILELHNVRMKPSNVRKKIREPPNVKKELSHVMLELQSVRMKPSNVRNKIREPPNVTKELSHVMLELQCEDGTVKYEKKSKGTTECDKRNVTCDVGTAQCVDETIKCEKKK